MNYQEFVIRIIIYKNFVIFLEMGGNLRRRGVYIKIIFKTKYLF
jgi:hypothetical protein